MSECRSAHRWRTRNVGDDSLVCDACKYWVDFVEVERWPDHSRWRIVKAYRRRHDEPTYLTFHAAFFAA